MNDVDKGSIILDLIVEGFDAVAGIDWIDAVRTVLKNGSHLIEFGKDAFVCYAFIRKVIKMLRKWFKKCHFKSVQVNGNIFDEATLQELESFCEKIEKKIVKKKEIVSIDSEGNIVNKKTETKYYFKQTTKTKIEKKRGKRVTVSIKEYSDNKVSWKEVVRVYEK